MPKVSPCMYALYARLRPVQRADRSAVSGCKWTLAEQVKVLKDQGFSDARVYDDAFFLREYGRSTNVGFTLISAKC